MVKYVVEVRMWIKQTRPSRGSREYEMPRKEASEILMDLIEQGVEFGNIRIRRVE